MDMRFGTWMYKKVCKEQVHSWQKYQNIDLVGVQEVRWDGGGIEPAGEYNFFLWKREWESWIRYRFFVLKRIISADTRVEFVNDRMPYMTSITNQRISKHTFSTMEKLCSLRGPCRVSIKKCSAVENSSRVRWRVEFRGVSLPDYEPGSRRIELDSSELAAAE
jgi:hypothetical protein